MGTESFGQTQGSDAGPASTAGADAGGAVGAAGDVDYDSTGFDTGHGVVLGRLTLQPQSVGADLFGDIVFIDTPILID